jgi:hypothetical protein
MSLNMKPDLEARLIARAQASGLSVEDFLQQVLEERSGVGRMQRLGAEEWAAQFEEWAESFPESAPIPDEALSRENLYPDRL